MALIRILRNHVDTNDCNQENFAIRMTRILHNQDDIDAEQSEKSLSNFTPGNHNDNVEILIARYQEWEKGNQ